MSLNMLCVCPTYGRPKLLANAVACFMAQDYPKERRCLIALDDAGQYEPFTGNTHDRWQVHSVSQRMPSMPTKYKALYDLAHLDKGSWDVVVNWDDDDIYLPNHLSSHAEVINRGYAWSQPQHVYCAYKPITIEKVGGNMWAAMAVKTSLLKMINLEKWYCNRRNAFDLDFLTMLNQRTPPGRSDNISFMFRWQSTKHPHLQGYIDHPDKDGAYQKFPQHDKTQITNFTPQFDEETVAIMEMYKEGKLPCLK